MRPARLVVLATGLNSGTERITGAPNHMPTSLLLSNLCRQLLSDSLHALEASPDGIGDETVVHDLRVLTKKLRAAWKIGAEVVGEELETQRGDVLRELSALLAGNRDLAVLVNLSRELSDRHGEPAFHEVIYHLQSEFTESADVAVGSLVKEMIESEIEAWGKVEFADPAAEIRAHRAAIRKSERSAKRATSQALHDNEAELWHTWRKRVKRLRYQRDFLAKIQGRNPGIRDQRISRLGSRLGDRNDLANLTHLVETLGNKPDLRKVIAQEERRIMSNCRRLGRRNLLRR